jgi:membrane fusion protein, multidrug efflux system
MNRTSLNRGASPLGLPDTRSHAPLRRRARFGPPLKLRRTRRSAFGAKAGAWLARWRSLARPRRTVHQIPSSVSVLVAALAVTALSAQMPRTVEVVRVVTRAVVRARTLPGEFVPYESAPLYARVSGFVERVLVDRGSEVRAGQTLLVVTAPELAAQEAEAEAKVAAVRAQQAETQAKIMGAQNTYEGLKAAAVTKGAVAANELVQAQKAVDALTATATALEAQVRAAEAFVRAQRQLQSYLRITAPFDGIITERNVHPGALVGPQAGTGAPPLLRLENVRRLRLVVAVPEADVASVTRGTDVEFTVPAHPSVVFHGRVARLAGTVDPRTRTMAVELDVTNTGGQLAAGMYPDVRWPIRSAAQTLVVPKTSVVVTTERVFVVRVRGGRAEWVDVKRGVADKDAIEVFGDLKTGDDVMLRGTDEIRHGAAVTPHRAG